MVKCSKCGKSLGMLEAKHKEDGKVFCSSCYREHKEEKEKEKLKKVLEKNDKWGYQIIQLSTKKSGLFMTKNAEVSGEEKLNELGKKGWELVSVVGIQAVSGGIGLTSQGTTKSVAFILKRKKA